MGKRLSLDEVKKRLKSINENIEILGEFKREVGKSKRLYRFFKCRCLKCKKEFDVRSDSLIKRNSGCQTCSNRKKNLNKTFNLDIIKKKMKSINDTIEIIGGEYINRESKLICRCKIHENIWETEWSRLSEGQGCKFCGYETMGKKQSMKFDEFEKKVYSINKNIYIYKETYVKVSSKVKCKCLIDGNVFETLGSSLIKGVGCKECFIRNNSGENNYNWKGGISPLHEYLRYKITKWKIDSFKKYNYKCDITKINNSLIVHHLYNFSDILKETMDSLNIPIYNRINQYTNKELKIIEDKCLELHYKYGLGVCLCKEEHKLFHKLYGDKNNTKEEYENFKKMRLKKLNKAS